MEVALLVFAFSAGAAAFFAPCSAAMIPGYVAYAVERAPDRGLVPGAARWHHSGHLLAFTGMLPLGGGMLALITQGFGGVYPLPASLWRLLPSFTVSTSLLLAGAGVVVAGLVLAGSAATALRGSAFALLAVAGSFTSLLLVGVPLALVAEAVLPYLRWISVGVGVLLVALGALLLAERTIPVRLPAFRAGFSGPGGYYRFGLAYGLAGLTCTFPAFLGIMGAGLAAGGFANALAVFLAYGAGKAAVLVALTTAAVAGATHLTLLTRNSAAITRASGFLLVLAGAYMIYYFGSVIA